MLPHYTGQWVKGGKVYLVGAGPGDPKLLTVKGAELLRLADVVVYDHLVSPHLLTQCPAAAQLVYMGKEARHAIGTQPAINRLLVREARRGKRVIRLKGGDPFLFGRGGEEALALAKAGVRYEVVPGVTSALAVPAYAGIPVTHRALASSVAIVTGHEDPGKSARRVRWERLARACDTIVCLMGVRTLPSLVGALMRGGRAPMTGCAVIEWGTWPTQRTTLGTLQTIAAAARRRKVRSPAVLVVGDVAWLAKKLAWFEAPGASASQPLLGQRIVVTRAADRAQELIKRLEALGAVVEPLPAIQLVAVKPHGAFRTVVQDLPKTDWVFFTSPEGIGWFARRLKPYRKDVQVLSGCRIGAIGTKTAASIEAHGLQVDFVPRRFSQEGILADLPGRALRGKRALLLSAEGSRDALAAGLRERGMLVTKVPMYRTVIPSALRRGASKLCERPLDLVTVTSASCVEHLFQALEAAGAARRFRQLRFASIGPVTSQAVRARGGRVVVEATVSTIEGLVDSITALR